MAALQRKIVFAFTSVSCLSVAVAGAQGTAPVQGFGTDRPAVPTVMPSADRDSDAGRGERGGRGGRRGGRRNGDGNAENRRDRSNEEGSAAATSAPPATATTGSGFGTAAPGVSDASRAEGIRKWAVSLIQRHDKNNNMMLEAAEQGELRGQSRGADLNSDGTITLDELVSHVSPKPAPTATSPTTGAAAKPAVSESRESAPAKRVAAKSYRFRSAKERQPEGLPNWFTRKDTNGDGQVSMSEYSRNWTDRAAAEFQRYDRDNDGAISPKEVRK